MGRLTGAVDRFWFAEGSATLLAVLRLIVGSTAVVFLALRVQQYTNIAGTSADLFDPVGPVVLLPGPIPQTIVEVLMLGTIMIGVAFVLGWHFRWTGPLFATLLLVIVSYRNSWSMVYHVDNVLILHVLVLGLTRSADALSLDALGGGSIVAAWRRFVGEATGTLAPSPERQDWHWEYGYPIRLLCAVTIAVYALSATAKLVGPVGLSWALGEGLRNQVGFDSLRKELLDGGAQPLAYLVFNNLPLATTMGIGTLLLEGGSIIALFGVRIGRVWAVLAYVMHLGIYWVMGIAFWYQLTGLAFVPFLIGEDTVRWCRAGLARWTRALAPVPGREPAPEHPSESASSSNLPLPS